MKRRQLAAPAFDLERALEILRELIMKADTFATMAERQFERCCGVSYQDPDAEDDGERPLEHMGHLLCETRDSTRAALKVG